MKRRSLLGLFGAALLAPFVPPLPGELATSTITTFDGLLREYYAEGTVKLIGYDHAHTFFQMIQKREDFT